MSNPIDFLATGASEQLGIIIDYCEHKFENIDAMAVVFGSAVLFEVENVYNVLSVKLEICNKPIYPVLPSVVKAQREIQSFIKKGYIHFPDEVVPGKALSQVYNTPEPTTEKVALPKVDIEKIRAVINSASEGYLTAAQTESLLNAVGIPGVVEIVEYSKQKLLAAMDAMVFPGVMKVVEPLHKSDAKGVIMNITSKEKASETFDSLMKIESATAVMVQPHLVGLELFVGVMKEPGLNHTILCGLGEIFIEVLNDVAAGLSPISKNQAEKMVRSLRGYELIKRARGKEGVDENRFVEIVRRLSALVETAPEITEMVIKPLSGTKRAIMGVNARVKIEKL